MKVFLKLLDSEKELIENLKKAVNSLDLEEIDNLKQIVLKRDFDLILNEKELPEEFNDYILSYKKLDLKYNEKLNDLIKKAKKEKKDILAIWGNYEQF